MDELRGRVVQCICESRTGVTVTRGKDANFVIYPSSDEQVADQILAVVEPQILMPDEAEALAQCFAANSVACYGSVNKTAHLYLKLLKIAEGQ